MNDGYYIKTENMGNIFEDIVQDIEVKPSKSKLVIKWVVRIAVLLIGIAFIAGQIKIQSLNKVNNFEKSLQQNTQAITDLNKKVDDGFKATNKRIDKAYDDGSKIFNDYVTFNKEQLKAVIDYGQTNKEMLKRMLDLNVLEKTKTVENQVEKAKKDTINYTPSIIVKEVKPKK
jgi:Sec7-like guanine-nucleotide exchange factor